MKNHEKLIEGIFNSPPKDEQIAELISLIEQNRLPINWVIEVFEKVDPLMNQAARDEHVWHNQHPWHRRDHNYRSPLRQTYEQLWYSAHKQIVQYEHQQDLLGNLNPYRNQNRPDDPSIKFDTTPRYTTTRADDLKTCGCIALIAGGSAMCGFLYLLAR